MYGYSGDNITPLNFISFYGIPSALTLNNDNDMHFVLNADGNLHGDGIGSGLTLRSQADLSEFKIDKNDVEWFLTKTE